MNDIEIIAFCTDVVTRSKFAYLTTVNKDNEPETRAMLNLYNREQYPTLEKLLLFPPYEIYFTTNTSSEKMKGIESNTKSCVYFVIESDWHGIMLNGDIDVVKDQDIKKKLWQDEWVMYYTSKTKDYTDPDYSILKLTANYIKGWTGREKIRFEIKK